MYHYFKIESDCFVFNFTLAELNRKFQPIPIN